MGSFFRSEKMTMTQIFLPTDSAYFCVAELGELGQVQIRDVSVHMMFLPLAVILDEKIAAK